MTWWSGPLVHEPLVLVAASFIAGIGLYFSLSFHPTWTQVALVGVASGLLWAVGALMGRGRGLALVCVAALGFAAAHLETQRLSTPLLKADGRWASVSGELVRLDYRDDGPRLVLHDLTIQPGDRVDFLAGGGLQLSLTGSNQARAYQVGKRYGGRVQLFPIGPPVTPGGLDLQRRAFFQGVSAFAATRGDFVAVEEEAAEGEGSTLGSGLFKRFENRVEELRGQLRERVLAHTGERTGPILVAMTLGFSRGIEPGTLETIRETGLAHLLAISGLHMTLIVGVVFWLTRLVLALGVAARLPGSWRWPVKKIAILLSLAAALAYFWLAGRGVPVQRALLMTAMVGLAVLLDRRALSMRSLALAALLVSAISPHVVLGPSFQMSFAAVTALVAVNDFIPRQSHQGLAQSAGGYVVGVALTSGIATLATAVLTLFHFAKLSGLSVVTNLIAVPLAAFIIMPFALLAFVLMPLGLEAAPLWVADQGLRAMLFVAENAAQWPAAVIRVDGWPRYVPWLFLVAIAGLAALQRGWKFLVLVPVVTLIVAVWWHRPASLVINPESLIAVHDVAGEGALVQGGVDDFERSFLEEYWNASSDQLVLAEMVERLAAQPGVACEPDLCLFQLTAPAQWQTRIEALWQGDGLSGLGAVVSEEGAPRELALALSARGLRRACGAQAARQARGSGGNRPQLQVNTPLFLPRSCRGNDSSGDSWNAFTGPLVFYQTRQGGWQLSTDLERRGRRPWTTRNPRPE